MFIMFDYYWWPFKLFTSSFTFAIGILDGSNNNPFLLQSSAKFSIPLDIADSFTTLVVGYYYFVYYPEILHSVITIIYLILGCAEAVRFNISNAVLNLFLMFWTKTLFFKFVYQSCCNHIVVAAVVINVIVVIVVWLY